MTMPCQHCCEHEVEYEKGSDRCRCKKCAKVWGGEGLAKMLREMEWPKGPYPYTYWKDPNVTHCHSGERKGPNGPIC